MSCKSAFVIAVVAIVVVVVVVVSSIDKGGSVFSLSAYSYYARVRAVGTPLLQLASCSLSVVGVGRLTG